MPFFLKRPKPSIPMIFIIGVEDIDSKEDLLEISKFLIRIQYQGHSVCPFTTIREACDFYSSLEDYQSHYSLLQIHKTLPKEEISTKIPWKHISRDSLSSFTIPPVHKQYKVLVPPPASFSDYYPVPVGKLYLQTCIAQATGITRTLVPILSGSLSPVHQGHLQMIESDPKSGIEPIMSYLVPSSEHYVNYKLRKHSLPLAIRVSLCMFATAAMPQYDTYACGIAYSLAVRDLVQEGVSRVLDAAEVVEVFGTDFLERAHYQPQPLIIAPRPRHLGCLDSYLGRAGVRVRLGPMQEYSSTALRASLAEGEAGEGGIPVVHDLLVRMRWLQDGEAW
eukprot:gnl/Dysnectes_brevis/1855_a2128_1323.p1 GENE.gnl/Dysnectes_brevis/1855_a2128_1323~~gnl/Dysnectes_brevis/1855_a2128_1323.p1  ORF type:complete len:335 (-),score=40.09 gnl/Dysnectes_brevis/1855_a2128_1323:69-1073(-)